MRTRPLMLLDTNRHEEAKADFAGAFEMGQLLTPLTRFSRWTDTFAIDNGAFSAFDAAGFRSLLKREQAHREKCIFVAVPDVVGCARRTLEVFDHWAPELDRWPKALVAQDGQEDLPIPWSRIKAVFVGGSTEWKCGRHAGDIIKAAQGCEKWVHVGRVNGVDRLEKFMAMGVDSIDGSGISQYSHMRRKMVGAVTEPPKLFGETKGEAA